MANKKVLFILTLLIAGPILWWALFSSPTQEEASPIVPQEVTNKVTQTKEAILSQVIRTENQKGAAYQNFAALDFSADFYLQDPKVTAEQGRKFLEETYSDLKKCYRQGCGQGPDKDGFYDPALTVAMISMKRVLEVTLLEPEKLGAKDWLTMDELKDMLNVENEDVRKLAFKNLIGLHKDNPEVFQEILRESDQLEGEKAADLVGELMNYVDENNRDAFLSSLEMIAKEKDAYTANKVLRRTQEMSVDANQIKVIGQELCRFKNDTFNFNGLNYSLKNMAAKSDHQFSLKDYCR